MWSWFTYPSWDRSAYLFKYYISFVCFSLSTFKYTHKHIVLHYEMMTKWSPFPIWTHHIQDPNVVLAFLWCPGTCTCLWGFLFMVGEPSMRVTAAEQERREGQSRLLQARGLQARLSSLHVLTRWTTSPFNHKALMHRRPCREGDQHIKSQLHKR